MQTDISVIFCTCDSYSDLWDNFFVLFKKYWPEFDGEIIFNTESKHYTCKGLNIVFPKKFPQNSSWSNRLYNSLKSCTSDKVLLILEDFYFKAPVKHAALLESLAAMDQDSNLVSISYQVQPGMYKRYSKLNGFQERKQFSLYKMNASLTLYKKDYLMALLKDGEDAWEFEVNATVRSWFKKGKCICKDTDSELVFPYDGAGFVRHGKFVKTVKTYFEEVEGLCFSETRGVLAENEQSSRQGGTVRKLLKYGFQALRSFLKKTPA